METLQITKENAVAAFKEADDKGRALLSNLFGKKNFLTAVTDRIKTFEDACEDQGVDPDDDKFTEGEGEPDDIAYQKLKVIRNALVGDWKADWNNGNQYKWAPWFYMNDPGFRFGDSSCDFTGTGATGGPRLCFPSSELATYAGKQFLKEYEAFMS